MSSPELPRPSIALSRWFIADLPSGRVWASLWALLASLGWLLPNHYYPWPTFHTDAWVAWVFLIGGAGLLLKSGPAVRWHRLALLAALMAAVPLVQLSLGLIGFAGQAWTTTIYLLGFLLSLLLGANAEETWPEQAIDALFLAIGLASIASVGIQLCQWFSLEGDTVWIVPLADMRPFGNLGQPNQMATFQLWGLISVGWAAQKNRLGPAVCLLLALFLLLGIALTQSRTAFVAIFLLFGAACYWRRLWPSLRPRAVVAFAAALVVYFIACLLLIEPISNALLLDRPFSAFHRIGGQDVRWEAYKAFIDAALRQPWFGYGWTTLAPAQIAVAQDHPNLLGVFQSSHNLFLDLVLWLGIPLGGAVSVALLAWFFNRFRRVATARDALLIVFVGVVAFHAMLELPLHYAYILLPAGLVMGTLDTRLGKPAVTHTGRGTMVLLWSAAAILLSLVTREYLLIEADFQAVRFEQAYRLPAPARPPPALVLSHLADFTRLSRGEAKPGSSQQELDQLRDGADAFPSAANLYLYTASLALNGRRDEAHLRMRKLVKIMPPSHYERLGRLWTAQSEGNKALAKVEWLSLEAASAPQAVAR